MNKQNLTANRIQTYSCPSGKAYVIFYDAKLPGFGLRVMRSGFRTYVLDCRIAGRTARLKIGDARAWDLGKARVEAARLRTLIDQGIDPREIKAEAEAVQKAKMAKNAALAVTVREAWDTYLAERRPYWSERHYDDHVKKAQAGGTASVRGTRGRGVTVAGPLYELMHLKLSELEPSIIEEWAAKETAKRATSARLAWRLLKSFLSWCLEHRTFSQMLTRNPATTKRSRQTLGSGAAKKDALQRSQLPAWFDAVRAIPNPVIAAYFQTVLLVAARPGEVLEIRWEDLDLRWNQLTIRDKVEGERTIPLTPYVRRLLTTLPRRSEFVFSSARPRRGGTYTHISSPNHAHTKACREAGIEHLTLNGLRRSLNTLNGWIGMPTGAVAQLMGHKPSATAEKHYTVRAIDLLRDFHVRIEAWILECAGVEFVPTEEEAGYLHAA